MAGLNKEINLPRGVALAVGMVLGSGMLGLPGIVVAAVGSRMAIASWLAVILAMVPMVAIFSRLGSRYTTAAGLTEYARIAFGPWAADATSVLLWGTYAIGIPALAWVGGAYVCSLFDIAQYPWGLVCALMILLASTIVNLLGTRLTALINTISLWMIAALICILVGTHLDLLVLGIRELPSITTGFDLSGLISGAGLIVWAFLGWENMSFSAEEFRNPKRNIPMTYWISFAVVSALYLALAFVVNGAEIAGTHITGASGLTSLLPDDWKAVITVLIVIAILANANSWVLGASRLTVSAGRNGLLPGIFTKTNRNGVPVNALIAMQAIYTGVIVIAGLLHLKADNLVGIVSQDFIVLYVVSIIAFIISERNEGGVSGASWLIALLSLVLCGIILTGFTWWILYPTMLVAVGAAVHRRRMRRGK